MNSKTASCVADNQEKSLKETMSANSPVEINSDTGVWKPMVSKPLKWDHAALQSLISAGYRGGHKLLDYIVCEAMPWIDPMLKDHLSKQESLFYEEVGMKIEKGSDEVILVDINSNETAKIDKNVFLKLIANLREDFRSSSKLGGKEKDTSESKDLATDGKHGPKLRVEKRKFLRTTGDINRRRQQEPISKKVKVQKDPKRYFRCPGNGRLSVK